MVSSSDNKRISGKLHGYSDDISSKIITSFVYKSHAFQVECNRQNKKKIQIKILGGYYEERDGRAFKLNYYTKDNSIFNKLQKIIEEYKITYNNGFFFDMKGVPDKYGDTIMVCYDTEEKIFKSSNQINVIPQIAIKEIYDIFQQDAIKNGYDFTSEKSNEEIFNDADERYLQGEWRGTYFDKEYIAFFSGNNVKIYCENQLIEDDTYIIIRGSVRKNQKKKEVLVPSSEYDFEELRGISFFRKKNDYILIGYFMEDNYLTAELKRAID